MKNRVLKILIVVFIIILIIFIILGINLTRKHLLFKEIKEKLANYKESNNYYIEATGEENEIYYYKLDDKEVEKRQYNNDDSLKYEIYKVIGNNQRNIYKYQKEKNTAILNSEIEDGSFSDIFFNDVFKTSNKWNYIKFLLNVKVTSKKYNGKDCYCINVENCLDNLTENVGGFLTSQDEPIYNFYIEKDTSLIIHNPFQLKDYEYKFDCVTENDITEPDISEFEIEE